MRAGDINRIRRRLALTQAQFAALLGVTRVTVARWEIGTVAVPKPMAKLIRMVVKSRAPRKEK
jgi:DNA-binding transcriptional regulator YiaG